MNDAVLNKSFISNLAAAEEPDPDAAAEFALVVLAAASASVAVFFAAEPVLVGVGMYNAVVAILVTSPSDIVYVHELMLPVPP